MPGGRRLGIRCPHPVLHRLQLLVPYGVMVALNATAFVSYDRAATDGYAMSYVQPDGATFAVWSVIYMGLLALSVLGATSLPSRARTALAYSFLLNGAWLLVNGAAVRDGISYWFAVVVLWAYLSQLVVAYVALDVDYARSSAWKNLVVHAPVSINLAWVTLASLLNFSNTAMPLGGADYDKREFRCVVGGPDWAVAVLGAVGLVAVYLALERADVAFGAVVVWALAGVVRHQTPGSKFPHPVSSVLRDTAVSLAAFVVVGCVLGAVHRRLCGWAGLAEERGAAVVDSESEDVYDEDRTRPLVSVESASGSRPASASASVGGRGSGKP